MLDENKAIPIDVEEDETKERTRAKGTDYATYATFTAKKDFKTPIIFGKQHLQKQTLSARRGC